MVVLPTKQLQECSSGPVTADLSFKPTPHPGATQQCRVALLGELGQEWVIY